MNSFDRQAFAVRRTRIADAPLLPAIERSAGEAFRQIPSLAWLADGDDHPVATHLAHIRSGTSWIALDSMDAPIGFLIGDRSDDRFFIVEFSVKIDRQRSGTGSSLLSFVIDQVRQENVTSIMMTTFRDVAWNAPFYRRFGFREIDWNELAQRFPEAQQRETAVGLPREMRCAMQLDINNDPNIERAPLATITGYLPAPSPR